MTLEIWFWLFMALWVFFGVWREWVSPTPNWLPWGGWMLLQFLLFMIIGWRLFGSPVK